MTGKRNWFVIRKHLVQAAENKIAKAPFSDVLYIPEVFAAERKAELAQRHLSAVSRIRATGAGPRRLMLLIGEVRSSPRPARATSSSSNTCRTSPSSSARTCIAA